MDAFHVVTWVNAAIDEIRRDLWNDHRKSGDKQLADAIKRNRWALLKNPENLTTAQQVKLADLERSNQPLYRAYRLKEQLRLLLKQPAQAAAGLLDQWLVWASNCRLKPFVKVASTVQRIRTQIDATLEHGLSNGLVESVNAKTRLIQQRAFGFHQPEALITLAQLNLSDLWPPLPGRTTK
jgi:transposase